MQDHSPASQSQTITDTMTPSAADHILKQFDCVKPGAQPPASTASFSTLQQALQVVAQHSDFQILGICANSVEEGVAALHSYASALGYSVGQLPESFQSTQGPAYIKFNAKAQILYADSYTGDHRGVLVSCQSAYSDGLNEMYGHLPLTLFDAPPLS
ncbi:MAG: DUF1824 family protein [Elainellaceae cyanobacterium]